jgi:nitrite reductase (NADH) large subunit
MTAPVPAAERVAGRVFLGPIPAPGQPVFRTYTQLPRRVPIRAWRAVRAVSVASYVALVIGLFVSPAGGLFVFFRVIVPVLPLIFFVAPGLWRNICPLSAVNQAPRVFGFTRAFTPPAWLRRHAFAIALVLFFGITSARIAVFNTSGRATGILLAVTIASAFLGGVLFKGKSGWCSSVCPLLPLQRAYGQTPSSRCRTAIASRAWAAQRTATTSSRRPPTRPTCTTRTAAGCPRASCSPPPCLASYSASSR